MEMITHYHIVIYFDLKMFLLFGKQTAERITIFRRRENPSTVYATVEDMIYSMPIRQRGTLPIFLLSVKCNNKPLNY